MSTETRTIRTCASSGSCKVTASRYCTHPHRTRTARCIHSSKRVPSRHATLLHPTRPGKSAGYQTPSPPSFDLLLLVFCSDLLIRVLATYRLSIADSPHSFTGLPPRSLHYVYACTRFTDRDKIDDNGDGVIDYDEFREFNRHYPALLFPAFQMQQALRRITFGDGFWQKETSRRHQTMGKVLNEPAVCNAGC